MRIKAIETVYKGYRFRSRLEARWAVFFDHMGIKFEYELEGFELKDGSWYLPDFFLPHFGIWVEVKPLTAGGLDEGRKRCALFTETTQQKSLLLTGCPDFREYPIFEPNQEYEGDGLVISMPVALISRWFCEHRFGYLMYYEDPSEYGGDYQAAVHAARSARFEHGERQHA